MTISKFTAIFISGSVLLSACGSQTAENSHAGHGNEKRVARAVDHTPKPRPVPAFQSAKEAQAELKPTLDPQRFQGNVRAAYAAVREIPETIAQLPCYCRCDRSAGHKSLYSCFLDEHGASCSICTSSVLLALKMQKEQNKTPEEIRAALITEYAGY